MKKYKFLLIIILVIFCFSFINKSSSESETLLTYVGNTNLYNYKEIYLSLNKSLDDIRSRYDKKGLDNITKEINLLKDTIYKQELLKKVNKISSEIDYYNKMNNIKKNNPDKLTNINMNKKNYKVLETLKGNITAYTAYCSGCGGYTGSGQYIGGGNIFYEDKEFGTVRIVAGDSSYPYGTIVRIKGLYYFNQEDVYAIILDRGGAIGKNRWALFDLLFVSESNANDFGVQRNIECEILRLGY